MQQSINLHFKIYLLVGVAPVVWFVVATTVIEDELASKKCKKKYQWNELFPSNLLDRYISFQYLGISKYGKTNHHFLILIWLHSKGFAPFWIFSVFLGILLQGKNCKGKSYFKVQVLIWIDLSNVNIT